MYLCAFVKHFELPKVQMESRVIAKVQLQLQNYQISDLRMKLGQTLDYN